jgi:hypothetical protein
MAYIGTQPKDIRSFGKAKFDFTATQGQTAFTGADDDGKTLGFTAGQVSVYVNGILMDDSDYTASNGNTITLTSAANASDIISVVALQTDIPNSDYVPATGGTFSGAVTHTGAFTSRGIDDNATSTAMTLDASGNLLVGKTAIDNTTAGHRLDASGFMSHVRAGNTIAVYNRLSSDGTLIDLRKDGTMVGGIGTNTNGNFQLYGAEASHVGLQFGSPSILPINNSGTSADNAVDLGDSNVRFKDLYLSGGVYLGGTGAANKLDDYEEGTFTPHVNDGVSNATAYGYNLGWYTKVGNICHFYIDLRNINSSNLTGTNALYITGLPFTSLSSGTSYAAQSVGVTVGNSIDWSGYTSLFPNVGDGNNSILIRMASSGTTSPPVMLISNINGGTNRDFWFSGSYIIA